MTLPMPTLDHVVVNVHDRMDEAQALYARLGFTLTPRGYHSLGSINHLAIFGTDYLELIGTPEGGGARQDILGWPMGLNGLVWGTEDSASVAAGLKAAGVECSAPNEFTRPVELPGGARDAVFRTVRLPNDTTPAGRLYFCHHFTRDLVWRDEWRHHANGTVAVARALIVEPDPAAGAKLYIDMFGADSVRNIKGGKSVVIGNSRFDIVTEAELRDQFGDAAPDPEGRPAYMAGLTFRTASLNKAAHTLHTGKIADVRPGAGRLVVPAKQALNAVLEFVE